MTREGIGWRTARGRFRVTDRRLREVSQPSNPCPFIDIRVLEASLFFPQENGLTPGGWMEGQTETAAPLIVIQIWVDAQRQCNYGCVKVQPCHRRWKLYKKWCDKELRPGTSVRRRQTWTKWNEMQERVELTFNLRLRLVLILFSCFRRNWKLYHTQTHLCKSCVFNELVSAANVLVF